MTEILSADDQPLFIVGCARSGTTLTRNLLRRVPRFICPEETHFFRWSEPFRTPPSWVPHTKNPVLREHREIDGVTPEVFEALLEKASSKADLQRRYIAAFARANGIEEPYRWFDKTPQNVYGAALIAQEFPQAQFLNLLRNPLNVVASLQIGRQIKVPDLLGACNYWCEAVQIMETLTAAYPARVLTLHYEEIVADVPASMARILSHAGVDAPETLYSAEDAHPERDRWREALAPEDVETVLRHCGPLAARHGYDLAETVAQAEG